MSFEDGSGRINGRSRHFDSFDSGEGTLLDEGSFVCGDSLSVAWHCIESQDLEAGGNVADSCGRIKDLAWTRL